MKRARLWVDRRLGRRADRRGVDTRGDWAYLIPEESEALVGVIRVGKIGAR